MIGFLIYGRKKNSSQGDLLFKGRIFMAVDEEAAKTKALHHDRSLRRSRLMAVKAPPMVPVQAPTNIEVALETKTEAMTPEQMQAVLKPIEESI